MFNFASSSHKGTFLTYQTTCTSSLALAVSHELTWWETALKLSCDILSSLFESIRQSVFFYLRLRPCFDSCAISTTSCILHFSHWNHYNSSLFFGRTFLSFYPYFLFSGWALGSPKFLFPTLLASFADFIVNFGLSSLYFLIFFDLFLIFLVMLSNSNMNMLGFLSEISLLR